MTIGKEQEAQPLEGIEETIALDMNMKIMATEDTLAMRDEDTAQGPQVMRGPLQATPWLGNSQILVLIIS